MAKANSEVMDEKSFEGNWKVIGGDGDSQVYKARHRRWGKDVAVKILGPLHESCSEEDLLGEAELILSADSPFIMKVLGVFRGVTPHCSVMSVGVVMDVMERGSLYALQVKRKPDEPLPCPLVFRLLHQVAEGMKYLHSLTPALVHNNLKPENILLDKDLNVKISGFGLTRFANSVTTNRVKGNKTLYFAPPEAFPAPPPGGAKPAYDVYSYAVLMWTLFNPGPGQIIAKDAVTYTFRPNINKVREPIKKMKALGQKDLLDLMRNCWSQDPKNRQTFTEFTAVTERLYEENKHGIDYYVGQVKEEQDGVVILEEPRRDFQRLTLDTNTAQRDLSLSENNRKVTGDPSTILPLINVFFGRSLGVRSYPDHDDRFDVWGQVLCSESLTGRCYWEVEWSGRVDIAVTYRGISRKGLGYDCGLGGNDKSWSLICYSTGYSYRVSHNSEGTVLPVRPSSVSNRVDHRGKPVHRVAVYLDHPAGTLSFYDVSSDTKTHLYTFQTTFSEPLYAGFWVGFDSSVRLCEQR